MSIFVFIDPSASTTGPATSARPNSDDTFEVRLVVPDLGEGTYTVLACQHCSGAGRLERRATLTVPAPSSSTPWRWIILLVAALLITAIAGFAVHRVRARRLLPTGQVRTRLRADEPEVHVIEEPDRSPRHAVQLVPHADPGVQRLRERSP